MLELFNDTIDTYYCEDNKLLIMGDVLDVLGRMKNETVDVIFADPPYFLSNNGITCSGGKMISVNKGNWDKIGNDEKTSIEDKHIFNRCWIKACKRVLKNNGTIWISGTFHNIYSIGMALEQEGFKILNNITWQKTNPPPNLGCRCFTHSTETILWAKKDIKTAKHFFNYKLMKELNNNKQMKDVWTGSLTKKSEKSEGKHPTQKPQYLLERIILASTQKNYTILDPFCGSGTTGVEALKNECNFIGIDISKEYLEIAKRRLEKIENGE